MRFPSSDLATQVLAYFFAAQARTTGPINVHNIPSQAFTNVSSKVRGQPGGLPFLICSDSNESAPSLPLSPAPCEQSPIDVSVVQKARDITKCDLGPTASSFTIFPTIRFQTTPGPLRPPFSLIQPERLQVSSIAGSDLDMILYVFFPVS